MPDEDFALIANALQLVEKFASRLASGDAQGDICRSLEELRSAISSRKGISPAVNRLGRSVKGLQDDSTDKRRRDFLRDSPSVDRLAEAIQEELLPALKRAGYV